MHLCMPGHLILPFQGLCFPLIEFSGIDFLPFLQFIKIILNSVPVFPSAYISQPDVILTLQNVIVIVNCNVVTKLYCIIQGDSMNME